MEGTPSIPPVETIRLLPHVRDEMFRLLVDEVMDYAIFLLDPDGRIVSWNHGAERIKGYRAEEILGRHFSTFYSEQDNAAGKPAWELAEAIRTGRVEDEGWRLRKDGTRFWANVVITALRDDAGSLLGFAKVTRDLTERVKAEEARRSALAQDVRASALLEQTLRSAFLANASAALSRSSDYRTTLREVARLSVPALADWCTVSVVDEAGVFERIAVVHKDAGTSALTSAYEREFPPAAHRNFDQMQGLLAGRSVLVPVVTPEALERGAQSPEHLRIISGLGVGSLMMVPMRSRDTTVGVFSFMRMPSSVSYGPPDLALAEDLAGRAGLAVENMRLVHLAQAERDRALAQAGRLRVLNERATFLADASALFAGTLDHDTVLKQLAQLCVPRLGDWCVIEAVDGPGTRQVAVAHVDPAKLRWADQLRRDYPPKPNPEAGTLRVIHTGKPEVYREIPPEALERAAQSPEHLKAILEVGMKSALIVPLMGRGAALGALSLFWADTDRHYDDEDLEFVADIARRAGMAAETSRLYAEVKAAVEMRDEFLSIAGHELRTPLAALLLQIQGIVRTTEKGPAMDNLRSRLQKAAASGQRLDRLINQLLDVTRIAGGRLALELEKFDLAALAQEVAARFEEAAATAGSALELRLTPVVGSWDRLRLDQVLTNLLANAIKFGQGKPITVEVRAEGDTAVVRVVDQGIGIQPDEQRRIFERFERGVGVREFGGFGLGLWIARQIVHASGGTVEVESEPEKGAAFVLRLPREPTAPALPRRSTP